MQAYEFLEAMHVDSAHVEHRARRRQRRVHFSTRSPRPTARRTRYLFRTRISSAELARISSAELARITSAELARISLAELSQASGLTLEARGPGSSSTLAG
jgi:hypothetical protein